MIISDEQLTQVIKYLRISERRPSDPSDACDCFCDSPDKALVEQLRRELLALPDCRNDRVQEVRAKICEDYPIPADVVARKMIARSISDAIR